jgi:hypothetical protein
MANRGFFGPSKGSECELKQTMSNAQKCVEQVGKATFHGVVYEPFHLGAADTRVTVPGLKFSKICTCRNGKTMVEQL